MPVPKVSGMNALVTGGTDGIGRAVALGLARQKHRVIFVGRDPARGEETLRELQAVAPGLEHRFIRGDLSLLQDTARVADEVAATAPTLDAAVFCAGNFALVPEWTSEQLERSFVLNYLSRHLLARRLLPLLERAPSGRLVLVANAGKYPDSLDLDDLQHRRGKPGIAVAGRGQFANDFLARSLAERTSVEVTCVFPGVVRTDVIKKGVGVPWYIRMVLPIVKLFALAPEVAALTPVHLATSPDARGTSGKFFGPRLKPQPISAAAQNSERRERLWSLAEAILQPFLATYKTLDQPRTATSAKGKLEAGASA